MRHVRNLKFLCVFISLFSPTINPCWSLDRRHAPSPSLWYYSRTDCRSPETALSLSVSTLGQDVSGFEIQNSNFKLTLWPFRRIHSPSRSISRHSTRTIGWIPSDSFETVLESKTFSLRPTTAFTVQTPSSTIGIWSMCFVILVIRCTYNALIWSSISNIYI